LCLRAVNAIEYVARWDLDWVDETDFWRCHTFGDFRGYPPGPPSCCFLARPPAAAVARCMLAGHTQHHHCMHTRPVPQSHLHHVVRYRRKGHQGELAERLDERPECGCAALTIERVPVCCCATPSGQNQTDASAIGTLAATIGATIGLTGGDKAPAPKAAVPVAEDKSISADSKEELDLCVFHPKPPCPFSLAPLLPCPRESPSTRADPQHPAVRRGRGEGGEGPLDVQPPPHSHVKTIRENADHHETASRGPGRHEGCRGRSDCGQLSMVLLCG